jgi:hypothetical protein
MLYHVVYRRKYVEVEWWPGLVLIEHRNKEPFMYEYVRNDKFLFMMDTNLNFIKGHKKYFKKFQRKLERDSSRPPHSQRG